MKEKHELSEFSKIFGEIDNLSTENKYDSCLAVIRDKFNLEQFVNPNSLVSEPLCVLFAIYKALEYSHKLQNGYILVSNFGNQEYDQPFRLEDNSILAFDDIDEALLHNEDYYGSLIYMGPET